VNILQRTFPLPDPGQTGVLSVPERMRAFPSFTGKGVTIAIIDSGFYPHPDYASRVLAHVDATDEHIQLGTRYRRPAWYSWHGQMVAFIAAGDGRSSRGRYPGMAPGANLLLVKVANHKRQVKEADILRGLRWVIDHAADYGVRVVNISVGGDAPSSDPDHPLHAAVRALTFQGIVCVVAAGNTGMPPLLPPASASEAIVVGGYDDQNSRDPLRWRPYTSSFGAGYAGDNKPDLLAPAAWIASPILAGSAMERDAHWLAPLLEMPRKDLREARRLVRLAWDDLGLTEAQAQGAGRDVFAILQERVLKHKLIDARHQYVDGTSVSAAIVSGVVAQMLEARPDLNPAQVRAALRAACRRWLDIPPEQQGAGCLDAGDAVYAALTYRD
jgi:serine protease AprX